MTFDIIEKTHLSVTGLNEDLIKKKDMEVDLNEQPYKDYITTLNGLVDWNFSSNTSYSNETFHTFHRKLYRAVIYPFILWNMN